MGFRVWGFLQFANWQLGSPIWASVPCSCPKLDPERARRYRVVGVKDAKSRCTGYKGIGPQPYISLYTLV